jgi:pimeloyl-ACP methyl ester carboxylesterase
MVITGVAARMPERIRRLAYVDAALPDPGESLFDQFGKGGVSPLSFAGLEAAAAYVEKIVYDPRTVRRIPKTYVLCSGSEFAAVTRVAKQKVAAQGGWRYLELPTSHVPMATMPRRFYRLILEEGQ